SKEMRAVWFVTPGILRSWDSGCAEVLTEAITRPIFLRYPSASMPIHLSVNSLRESVRRGRLRAGFVLFVPVSDLVAGHEDGVGPVAQELERPAEGAKAMRHADQMRVQPDRHDAGPKVTFSFEGRECRDRTLVKLV